MDHPAHASTPTTRARLAAVALVAAAFGGLGLVAGCGDDDDGGGTSAAVDPTTTTSTSTPPTPTCEDTTHDDRPVVLCTAGDAPDQGLVVALHPRGSSVEELRAVTELERYAAAEGLAVAYPETLGDSWGDDTFPTPERPTGDEDVRFLDDLIATLRSDPRIDDRPVGVVGFSNGASMTLRYAAQRPDVVRAAVTVAGELPRDPVIRPTQPVPLLAIYGTDDPIRSYDSGIPDTPGRQPGQPTPTLSAPDSVAAFVATLPGARHEGPTESDPVTDDGTRVRTESWTGDGGSVVVFRTIVDGGHTWPSAHAPLSGGDQYGLVSRDLDASAEAVGFLLDPDGLP